MAIEQQGNEWNLAHRFVKERYRSRGVAAALVEIAEEFVSKYAEMHGETQKIIINIGQPSVLRMFNKKGYKPQTEKDAELAKRILSKDDSLEEDYGCLRIVGPNGEYTDVWHQEKDKDPYVFERGTKIKSEQNALRVTLEKSFNPVKISHDTAEIKDDTRNRINGV